MDSLDWYTAARIRSPMYVFTSMSSISLHYTSSIQACHVDNKVDDLRGEKKKKINI